MSLNDYFTYGEEMPKNYLLINIKKVPFDKRLTIVSMLYFDENAYWINFIKASFIYYDEAILVMKFVNYLDIY